LRAWQAWYGNEAQLLGQVEDNEKLVAIRRWVLLSVRLDFRFVITFYGVWGLKLVLGELSICGVVMLTALLSFNCL